MVSATKVLRQAAAHAERTPLIKFVGKRTLPTNVDHSPHAHPASPTHSLPDGFGSASNTSTSFSNYRQQAQQHGPLGRKPSSFGSGGQSGHSLGPITPAKGEFFDRSQLPKRFGRSPFTMAEIEAIETGGATMVC